MKSKNASGSGDLKAGLPRGLYLIIHVILLVALGLTFHSHQEQDSATDGRAEAVLAGLLAAQVLLYLFFFRPAHADPVAGLAMVPQGCRRRGDLDVVGERRGECGPGARGVAH